MTIDKLCSPGRAQTITIETTQALSTGIRFRSSLKPRPRFDSHLLPPSYYKPKIEKGRERGVDSEPRDRERSYNKHNQLSNRDINKLVPYSLGTVTNPSPNMCTGSTVRQLRVRPRGGWWGSLEEAHTLQWSLKATTRG